MLALKKPLMIGSSGLATEWHAKGVDMAFYHIDDIGIGAMYIALKEMKAKGGPFEEAAKIGVSKININSDMRYAFRTTLEKVLADHPKEYAVVKLMPEVFGAVQVVVEEKIQAFGSAGKAVV